MQRQTVEDLARREYKYGFVTDIEADTVPPGLNEDVIRLISAKKNEPEFMLEWRLKAYRYWAKLEKIRGGTQVGQWCIIRRSTIKRFAIIRRRRRKSDGPKSLEEVDPELLKTYEKLGIPSDGAGSARRRRRRRGVRQRLGGDDVQGQARRDGNYLLLIFRSGARIIPSWCRNISARWCPTSDNFFAALNAAVFTDGSFCYIPKGVRCPMELSTYFRINAAETGQFERTLIIAEEGAIVSYLEGCTAPMRDKNQLHAAVVELVAHKDAQIKYSTVQNWYPGDKEGKGGIYNFVTKRGKCLGERSKISWTQVETGSAITWKYPSCILQGDDSVGEFYSVALTNNYQQADTGTKMIHIGKNTKSTIISKGISAGHGQNTYRGLVKIMKGASGARNYSQCDSLLLGDKCGAHTFPYLEVLNSASQVEHEASTSKIGEDQLFYCRQRGIATEDAVNLIVNGFCKQVFKELPMEFAVEAQKLLSVSLEGSVG